MRKIIRRLRSFVGQLDSLWVHHGVPSQKRVASGSHVVDSQDVRALSRQGEANTQRARVAFLDFTAEDFLQESFSRMADEQWPTNLMKLGDVRQQLEIMLGGFAEADSGVEHDALASDAGSFEFAEPPQEVAADVGDHVFVLGIELHRLRYALHVHDDHAAG